MDKAILKKFAIESRQELMQKIESKIKLFYVDEIFTKQQNGDLYVLSNDKHTLSISKEDYDKRELLIKRIQELGLNQVIEEAAYTWFNRIVAIRYMEIHDYLPLTKDNQSLGIRVLSSKDNTPDPEIMKFTNLTNPDLDIEFRKEKYIELKEDNEKFKYILLLVCKKLGKVIPQVFDGVTDYIDILIPDNLLNEAGFITKIINDVPEENYNQVEIIGWLYQYYNQTEKDRVISAKKAYKKNEIPYATQLFTPDWIVKYMVENSLGRYWVEHNGDGALYPSDNLYPSNNLYPSSSITDNWKYFIKDNIVKQEEKLKPTEITFIDPCCGSGHILVYAFEVFYQIYIKAGYNKNDIPELILKNNLYGLDIDDRAGQLSVLSVLLKAREYDKTIFNKDIVKNLNIMSLQESKYITQENIKYLKSKKDDKESVSLNETIDYIYDIFQNAKEIGSLLFVDNKDYNKVFERIKELNKQQLDIFDYGNLYDIENHFKCLIKQAMILSRKYDIVVTNPPYMNKSMMMENLKNYIVKNYTDFKSDMFSAFIMRNSFFSKTDSYSGYMTPFVWMFIGSYENVRNHIINNMNIVSLIQLEYSALEEATVPICTFVLKNGKDNNEGVYFKLSSFTGGMNVQKEKVLEALSIKDCDYKYKITCKNFNAILGTPIAYWLSNNIIEIFKKEKIMADYGDAREGMHTGNTERFIKFWEEIDFTKFSDRENSEQSIDQHKKKWIAYNKGGAYRKWYGNKDYVIAYDSKTREEMKKTKGHVRPSQHLYFKKGMTWTLISSSNFGIRCFDEGMMFDVSSHSFFCEDAYYYYIAAFMNTKIAKQILDVLNPTLNFSSGVVRKTPIIYNSKNIEIINNMVKKNIELSKSDWDSFETSWDFKKHPLLEFINSMPGLHDTNLNIPPTHLKIIKNNYGKEQYFTEQLPLNAKIEDSFRLWNDYTIENFNQLKKNEEELNEIFINIYGLQDELTSEVEDKDITIRKADRTRDIKSLISYAVGCMFGRYSLDEEGLIFAGGEFDSSKYKTFNADIDNIIPIADEAYFNDDIVTRFKQFIEVVYGKETLNENLDYIAETLGKKGTETSEETIRRYFLNDFYSDHIKTYQKRPIYWLFDSGKRNGFKCLIYMHRYNENTVPKVRLDYLHRIQTTYEKLLIDVNYKLTTELSLTEKKEAQKCQIDLNAKLQEIKEYDEKIAHIANQRISIDLDDGVTANYAKFAEILSRIK